jgi:hypothetical protein
VHPTCRQRYVTRGTATKAVLHQGFDACFARSWLPRGWWQIDAWIAIEEATRDPINSVAKHPLEEKSSPAGVAPLKRMPQNEVGILFTRFRTLRLPLDFSN